MADIIYHPSVLVAKPFFVDLGEGTTYISHHQMFTNGDVLCWFITDKAPFACEFFYGGDTQGSCCIKIFARSSQTEFVKYFDDVAACNEFLSVYEVLDELPGYLEVTRRDGSRYVIMDA